MKVVIAGGNHKADYIISMYKDKGYELVVINQEIAVCQWLASRHNISVYHGNPTKDHIQVEAGVEGADLFIALGNNDVENYVACMVAKRNNNVKRCAATVMNPRDVDIFKKLGVDCVINSTYLLAQQIKNEASIENLIKTLTLEDDKIIILEITIPATSKLCNMVLADTTISDFASISCIYRNGNVMIPNGSSILKQGDKVLVVTKKEDENKVLKYFGTYHEK